MEPNSSITIPRLDGSTSVVCGLATTEQIGPCRELYASAFGRPLSTADRMESDRRLADQPLTRNNRMKLWCVYLRDEPARVVAACKTVPREFLIREAQQPTRVGGGYCIASVVTDSEYRGLGIAAYLLKVIAEWLDETGTDANMLYSSVGSVSDPVDIRCSQDVNSAIVLRKQRLGFVTLIAVKSVSGISNGCGKVQATQYPASDGGRAPSFQFPRR